MNPRNKRLCVFVLVAGPVVSLVAIFVFDRWKPEPLYQGQSVSYWISQIAAQNAGWPSAAQSATAINAFERTDREGIPFLMATLKARAGWSDLLPERFWGFLPRNLGVRFRFYKSAVDQARFMAMGSLGRMGADAREAVPIFVDLLADRQIYVRTEAAHALGKVGMPAIRAVPALIRLSKDNELHVRLTALSALERIAPEEERVYSEFSAALSDAHKEVRFLAVEHFLRRARPGRAWLDAVIGLSKEPEASDRWGAIEVFRKSGPAILDALPALVERLSDDNNRVRGLAAIALGEVGPPAGAATPALTRALADEFSNVREAAAEALAKISSGEAAVPGQGLKTPR